MGLAVASLSMAGLAAIFNAVSTSETGETFMELFVAIFSLGGFFFGLFALFGKGRRSAKVLSLVGLLLNAWLLISIF